MLSLHLLHNTTTANGVLDDYKSSKIVNAIRVISSVISDFKMHVDVYCACIMDITINK